MPRRDPSHTGTFRRPSTSGGPSPTRIGGRRGAVGAEGSRERPVKARLVARAPASKVTELNLVGTFEDAANWKDDQEILEATKRDAFFPRTKELLLFARSFRKSKRIVVTLVEDFAGLLCAIFYHRPRRINVFTHGTSLKGQVVKGNVYFATGDYVDIDGVAADATLRASHFRCGGKGTTYRRQDVDVSTIRTALPKNAELIIYGCHSGSSKAQLRRIANLLSISVRGFKNSIRYYPVAQQRGGKYVIKDWQYSAGSGPKVSNYHELQPDVVVAPKPTKVRR